LRKIIFPLTNPIFGSQFTHSKRSFLFGNDFKISYRPSKGGDSNGSEEKKSSDQEEEEEVTPSPSRRHPSRNNLLTRGHRTTGFSCARLGKLTPRDLAFARTAVQCQRLNPAKF